jgi:hypothetical protein
MKTLNPRCSGVQGFIGKKEEVQKPNWVSAKCAIEAIRGQGPGARGSGPGPSLRWRDHTAVVGPWSWLVAQGTCLMSSPGSSACQVKKLPCPSVSRNTEWLFNADIYEIITEEFAWSARGEGGGGSALRSVGRACVIDARQMAVLVLLGVFCG